MATCVAFLRGMNLGGRRISNADLCAAFAAIGFDGATAVQASGNVIFDARGGVTARTARKVETGLEEQLGYPVPTFLRSAAAVAAIAAADPFADAPAGGGKLQVVLLGAKPTPAARRAVLAHATDADRLSFGRQELFWLPDGKLTESALDFNAIQKQLGACTVRTHRTIERIAARLKPSG